MKRLLFAVYALGAFAPAMARRLKSRAADVNERPHVMQSSVYTIDGELCQL